MIRLTQYDSRLPVYVLPSEIRSVRELPASCEPLLNPPLELGRRTRIDTATDMFLVNESAEEIMGLIHEKPK